MPMKSVKKPAPAAPELSLRVGDSVEHRAFGKGTVLTVRPMGPDSMLEVAFEKEGTKKLMLSSAGKFMKKI